MAEYIERQAALNIADAYGSDDAFAICMELAAMPSADVEPVRHGRWIWDGELRREYPYKCSECGEIDYYAFLYDPDTRTYKQQDDYCPKCGARMDGEADG